MARSGSAMPSPARRQPTDAEIHARLSARIEALEDRVRRLEARVRGTAAAARATSSAKRGARPAPPVKTGRARARCPGCTLELPPGPRGEACVWCGFLFDAVRRGRGTSKR
ncbi:hypothetical protein P2318_16785 [Myxococcaceae bacterium GXIMD 01537]